MSCTMQDLKTYAKMKNLVKTSSVQNTPSFASFSKAKLSKAQQKQVKGGDDVIIIEEVIEG